MRLPDPTLTLTIPSLHDDTVLSCRIYHPPLGNLHGWQRRAAVVSHPYAPLGGCYDDPVVAMVTKVLLDLGYLVGTFNFRGAHPSGGRTSWTGKPEIGDLSSFTGFIVYYLHHLTAETTPLTSSSPSLSSCSSSSSSSKTLGSSQPDRPPLLFAGYSYGALITSLLPPLPDVLAPLHHPALGSSAAEIRLRARHLAEQQRQLLRRPSPPGSPSPASPRRSLGVRIGGDEAVGMRKSNDFAYVHSHYHHHHPRRCRRSVSQDEAKIRKGVGEVLDKTFPRRKKGERAVARSASASRRRPATPAPAPPEIALNSVDGLIEPRPAYVLISPLQGIINHLATWSFGPSPGSTSVLGNLGRLLLGQQKQQQQQQKQKQQLPRSPSITDEPDPAEAKLRTNPTLAIYGDHDGFVSVVRLREWASRLNSPTGRAPPAPAGEGPAREEEDKAGGDSMGRSAVDAAVLGSRFIPVEVSGAGHFWLEQRDQLRDAVQEFARALAAEKS